jgi:hypothetical protein
VKRSEYVHGPFKVAIKYLAGDIEKKHEHLSQNRRRTGPGSISRPSEYKAGGLFAQPWPAVSFALPGIFCMYLD